MHYYDTCPGRNWTKTALFVGLLSLVLPMSAAHAQLLNGGAGISAFQGPPDITVSFVDVFYDASNDLLTITGFAESLDIDDIPPPDDYTLFGDFTLTATISSTGALVGTGTFTITDGIVPDLPGSGPLLTGTVTQFGYQNVSPFRLFDFIATNVTGDAVGLGFVPAVGIAVDAVGWTSGQAFTGSFNSNFNGSGFGVLDVFPVPEPSSVALALMGLVTVGALVGRRYSCLVRPTRSV